MLKIFLFALNSQNRSCLATLQVPKNDIITGWLIFTNPATHKPLEIVVAKCKSTIA